MAALTLFRPHVRAVASAVPLISFRASAGGAPIAIGLFIAHRWGRRELAAFTIAHATVMIVVAVTDWGGTRALPRNLATLAPEAVAPFLAAGNALRLGFVAAAIAVVAALAGAGAIGADAVRYLAILLPLCPLSILTTNALSERVVSGATRPIAVAVSAGLASFGALAAAALTVHAGAPGIAAAYVAGKAIEAVVLVSGRWWVLSVATTGLASAAAALWPFAAQMILGVVYSRLAVFTVERATTREEFGIFSVALALQNALLLVPASLALMQFPELSRRAQAGEAAAVRRLLVRYTIVAAAAVLCGALVMLAAAGRIAAALDVPRGMMPFVVAFAALAFPASLSVVAGFFLQARGEERLVSRLSVLTLALALVYQVTALRAFGLWGIVAAVGAGEASTIAVFALGARPRRGRRDGT